MEKEETMSNEESMKMITEMINKARFNFSRGSFYFILWGFLLMASATFEYFADHMMDWEFSWIGWPIVGVIGGVISSIYGARSSQGEPMTHLDRVYSSIWMTFFVTLAIFIIAMVSNQVNPGSYIMIITGFPTFLTGYVLRFNPLKWGGVGFWALGVLSLFLFDEYRSLIFGLAMIQGYIIPGFIMKSIRQ